MNGEPESSAKLMVEHRRDMMIFWAVMVLTCVVGIIGLLSEIKQPGNLKQGCLLGIYVVLFVLMGFGIRRTFQTLREIRSFAKEGSLGTIVQEKAIKEPTAFDRIIELRIGKYAVGKYVEYLVIFPLWIFFVLLYLATFFGW
jgi:hypothetical protein